MPLSPPAAREHLHTRRIECRGFRRSDGLWDIEGHITDTKTYPIANAFRGEIAPGEAIHDMWIRLTLDDDLVVRAVEAVTDAGPYRPCPAITPAFAKLKGLRIAPGWNKRVKELLGGVQGCTHLVELLGPVATVAFQTIFPVRERERRRAGDAPGKPGRPPHLNTCHALRTDGEVVKQHYPDHYTGS
jgi:hypothetical protein